MTGKDYGGDDETRDKGRADTGESQKKEEPFGGHPPIVILDDTLQSLAPQGDESPLPAVGDSMKIRFDGDTGHYNPDNVGSPSSYFASGIKIRGVKVSDGINTPHECPGVDQNSRIVVSSRKNGSSDKDITVTGGNSWIVIDFERGEFSDEGSVNMRRRFHGSLRKIRRMDIYTPGQPTHTCPAVASSGGICCIIIDDHG